MGSAGAAGANEQALNLALRHHRSGRLAEAEALYRQIIDADPTHADAFHLLGLIALQCGQFARAVGLIECADELSPSNPVILSNLAEAYQKLGSPERAKECCEQALELRPDFAAAHVNLGNALAVLGETDAAERCYRQALAGDPSLASGRLNLGLLLLLRGDYAAGLPLYEERLQRADTSEGGDSRALLDKLRDVPRWRGESLQGKRILVWTEQGLGDSVMMMRYLQPIRALGVTRLAVCCEPALVRLMQGVTEVDEVFSGTGAEDWPDRFDLHCPMMSLPLAFGTRPETIPARIPYLAVPHDLTLKWSAKVSRLPAPRVGLVWAGGQQTSADPRRSISLASFSPLLAKRHFSFVSLQKGPAASQLANARGNIGNWMDECGDLLETAALIGQLDLVVSVDTAVAHVAGALGKPVWLLNRTGSEWRWMLERNDSPWYPTMTIFRQRRASWTEVIRDMADALERDLGRVRAAAPATWLRRMLRL
jgi:tetratricopeptide (TPR) repeat protein